MITLTNRQARQFILIKQGLLGGHKFVGKQGVLDFARQAGCIQFDPVDVCGRSADISLNSRVKGYTKDMLDALLYEDRRLIDYFDKNLCIFPVEDLPAILKLRPGGGYAEAYDRRGGEAVKNLMPTIRRLIKERGYISAAEIDINETIEWHWSIMTSLPRAALESMYFRGELIIHHKTGTNKSYALMEDYIPKEIWNATLPYEDGGGSGNGSRVGRLEWHIRRRIGAVGMLWNRPSDAWLGLNAKTPERTAAFERLHECGSIVEIMIEGINAPLYILAEDTAILDRVISGDIQGATGAPRCEFIAPLDSMIWDRKLIKALVGFEYSWEIYTPAVKRKYGAYVLPILYGEQFIGRIEIVCERKDKRLVVKNIWYESGVKQTKKMQTAINSCIKRFAKFNGCHACLPPINEK
ncbi:MAG: winged helix DNA-binding domain-containing protein [Oscillospiraceae bacterium]|nr:winged helix DNA-binding domain-containing protein [Oscillospiraceae bacterium]